MKSSSHRFQKDNRLLIQYCAFIQFQHKAGIIELIDHSRTKYSSAKHYLSHYPVITSLKATTKFRIVYDSTVKVKMHCVLINVHIDDLFLYQTCACGTLVRFRLHFIIAVPADIEKAFLQIGVQEMEGNVIRFLWYTGLTRPEKVEGNFSFYCLPFGLVCSPFLLERTLRFHLKSYNTPLAKVIRDKIKNMWIMFALEPTQLMKQ